MSILFINGSPNKNGNTVRFTKKFLKDQEFKTLNLVDYKIYSYGQNFEDDQLVEVIEIQLLLVRHFIGIVCQELFVMF